jgi:hypothetical protein
VYNTNTLDAAAAKYWQLAGQFEGESCVRVRVRVCASVLHPDIASSREVVLLRVPLQCSYCQQRE